MSRRRGSEERAGVEEHHRTAAPQQPEPQVRVGLGAVVGKLEGRIEAEERKELEEAVWMRVRATEVIAGGGRGSTAMSTAT